MKTIGLDIGTTSVCGVVTDCETGAIIESKTIANDSALKSENAFERLQNPSRILEICRDIYREFTKKHGDAEAVGFTGQMHGILYLDENGEPLSPLFTWQDERGNQPYGDVSYAKTLSEVTGYKMATGYGLTTHFYNMKNGLVPCGAAKICTIHDFAAMKFAGLKAPLTHSSDAASLGLFDLEKGEFDKAALKAAGIDEYILPETVCGEKFIGRTAEGLSVAAAIGDNQASVFGSLKGEGEVLVNVGTGSQVSVIYSKRTAAEGVETRPYLGGKYLLCSCPLCGGYSYTLLKNFFAETLKMFGAECSDIYEILNRAAIEGLEGEQIEFNTLFRGTRADSSVRASAGNIGVNNFTPQNLTAAVLTGICEELYAGFESMRKATGADYRKLVGSGNGVRQNPALKKIFETGFDMKLHVPRYREEASYGCSLLAYALLNGGDLSSATKLIKYED